MAERIDYPASLPKPRASVVSPAEMRQLSDQRTPYQARALSVEHREFERLTFPAMNASQAEIFQNWWKNDLYLGGAWFNATWPLPRGLVEAVRKFVEPPRWRAAGRGYWIITAICEVRGRSLPVVNGTDSFVVAWDTSSAIGTITFSNGNRTATSSSSGSMCVDDYGAGAGKFYGEVLLSYSVDEGSSVTAEIGLTTNAVGVLDNVVGLNINGDVIVDGSVIDSVSPLSNNSVIGIALDTNANQVWLAVNGVWILGGNPAAGTGEVAGTSGPGTAYIYFYLNGIETSYSATLRSAQSQFSQLMPTGFAPWAS